MPVDRESGRPRGFAFVEYTERSVAEEAINKFNGQPFQGRNIAVSEARARESRPGGGRPPSRSSGASSRPSGPRMGSRPSMPSRGPGERSENFGPPATPKRLRSKRDNNRKTGHVVLLKSALEVDSQLGKALMMIVKSL